MNKSKTSTYSTKNLLTPGMLLRKLYFQPDWNVIKMLYIDWQFWLSSRQEIPLQVR